jgi:isocitrate/isopropylmalate dehydrogenase
MAAPRCRIACLTGCGTAPELMAQASRALAATARAHGLRVEQLHAPVGADSVVRHGRAVSPSARSAFLRSDAVLHADDDDAGLAELGDELDLRARLTRVLLGPRSDAVLLAPLREEAGTWTIRRAVALAASRRLRLAVVAGDARWEEHVGAALAHDDGVRVDRLDRDVAARRAAFDARSLDVVVADAVVGELLSTLAGASSSPRIAAVGRLAGRGPSVFSPLDTGRAEHAGHGVVDPSSMLLAAAMALGDGLGERSAADTLVASLGAAAERHHAPPPRPRRAALVSTREFTDAVLAGFQNHHVNAEFHPGVLAT